MGALCLSAGCGQRRQFVNNRLIEYCLGHGIELTRARPYRKNDQAWIEQKNGAVIRKLLGYRRAKSLAAARAIALYGASRLFVNYFQPSFKLAAKQRDGAKGISSAIIHRRRPARTFLQAESVPMAAKIKLRRISPISIR